MKTRFKPLFNLLIVFSIFASLLSNSTFIQTAKAATTLLDPIYKPLATPNTWDSVGAGLNGRVNRMVMVGKDLYVAGEFTNAGDIAEADYIAKWDGIAWSALGTIPLNNVVFTLATNGTDLYIAGSFTEAGGIAEADYIAKWDGTNWSAVGPSLSNSVYAIAISGTDVYVGGGFTNASGDVNADYIAKLTGGVGTWSALGTGTNGGIYSIAISGTDMYVGGEFTSAGGVADTFRIAKWDGATWSALGTGMDNTVYKVVVKGAEVYAGGDFSSAGGVANTSGIAKFSGGDWSALDNGLPSSYVRDIELIDGDVFVSGYFLGVDGNTDIKHLAKFSGGTWSALGAIAGTAQVDAIAISPGGESIYAGGFFTDWAGNENDYIARFEPASTTITVNTNADELNADGDCSLREAMQSAELNSATDACIAGNASGPDIIVFHSSLGTANIVTESNLPELSKSYGLTILGGGDITIDGDNTYRLFVINEKAYLKVDGLTVTRGNAGANYGGGLANNGGYAVITNSSFLSNSANGSGAVDNLSGDMVIANSTFSGNANTSDGGAAIYNYLGRLTIVNSTFSANNALNSAQSTITNVGTLHMVNTIIANTINGVDCSGVTPTGNNNLIESSGASACDLTNDSNGNIIGSDPNLGLLTGSPAYFSLNIGSPAIDAGDDTACAAEPVNNTSQNGVVRPQDTHCDIGAFELNPTIPTITSIIRVNPNPTALSSVNFTVTFSEAVTGVDMADFSLTTSGVSGATVSEVNGSGTTYTVTVNTGINNGTIRLDVLNDGTIQNTALNSLSSVFNSGESYTVIKPITLSVKSLAANDGWILESTETSGKGGTMNSTATNFFLGDDLADRQYRGILHFNTSDLPDTAVITSATLKIKKQGQSGSNPFTILGGLRVDMRKPSFGTAALALTDFKSAAGQNNVSTFGVTPVANWYSAILNATGNSYINRTGATQFRLYFTTDDNNDNGNDFMKFFSGNAGAASRPQLVIEYYVP